MSEPTPYHCACGHPVYFRNSTCLNCNDALGYDPEHNTMWRLEPSHDGVHWFAHTTANGRLVFRRCANLDTPAACNWLITHTPENENFRWCLSCRLSRTIPNLSSPANAERWRRIETAKRRLVAALLRLGLPVHPKQEGDPTTGLAFDFIEPDPNNGILLTGHSDGIITLNIEEAEAPLREAMRARMRERYRTILGHLRHETGHYYWEVLVREGGKIEQFRELFGMETNNYDAALRHYYQYGPPAGWEQNFISAYATAHPWEDWAECWAHYLHMVDTLETAIRFGLSVSPAHADSGREEVTPPFEATSPEQFRHNTSYWISLTIAVNEISAAMGNEFFYPFTLSPAVLRKLEFVHLLVSSARHAN